ncbi:UNVERIFIED_CONTAM: peptide ABC transporter permease [Euhalothece sp. KZN 001]
MNIVSQKSWSLLQITPFLILIITGIMSPTLAQNSNPNQNRFLQQSDPPQPLPRENSPSPASSPSRPKDTPNNTYNIETINVIGSSIFSEETFEAILNPLREETVSLSEISDAVRAITQLYLEQGYLTSRAVLVEDSLTTGNVEIRVLEGELARIEITGTERLNPEYIRSRLGLANEPILNTNQLEDQLRLLRINPLLDTIEASLRPGENIQESILVVRVQEANPWLGKVSLDNYSPPSVGSEEATVTIGNRNLTGNGDTLQASYSRTIQGGAEDLDFNYNLPINGKNGTIQLRTAFGSNEVIEDEFEDLGIEGDFDLVEISYRQPLTRTPREEFALSVGFTYQNGQTFVSGTPTPFSFGPNEDGVSRTSVIKLGQDYVKRSESGAWGLRSLFTIGTNIFDATENDGDTPDGQFLSWLGQAQRVQILSENNILIIQADIQLSSDPLLPSQQFVIGGGQSIRGYRQNILTADQGIRLSIEDQITLSSNDAGEATFKIAPFVEAGAVINKDDNPNSISQEQTVIASLGLGLLWNPISNLNLRLDYGIPLVDLENTGDNIQDDGLHFSLTYSP